MSNGLEKFSVFSGLTKTQINTLEGCLSKAKFKEGEYIFKQNQSADDFYMIASGEVSLNLLVNNTKEVVVQTVGEGEVLGISWLVPPYQWHFDALAIEPVETLKISARCLQQKMDEDPALGYLLMQRFIKTLYDRLQATRLQLLDVYE